MIRYWDRLTDVDGTRIWKRVFLWDYRLCHNNWSSEIKEIMFNMGLLRSFDNKKRVTLETRNSYYMTHTLTNGRTGY